MDSKNRYLGLSLPPDTLDALSIAAIRLGRRPKAQAVAMLTDALRADGYLAPDREIRADRDDVAEPGYGDDRTSR